MLLTAVYLAMHQRKYEATGKFLLGWICGGGGGGGISLLLVAHPILDALIMDALITRIPADEEPLCGNAAAYAVIIIIIILYSKAIQWELCSRVCWHQLLSKRKVKFPKW